MRGSHTFGWNVCEWPPLINLWTNLVLRQSSCFRNKPCGFVQVHDEFVLEGPSENSEKAGPRGVLFSCSMYSPPRLYCKHEEPISHRAWMWWAKTWFVLSPHKQQKSSHEERDHTTALMLSGCIGPFWGSRMMTVSNWIAFELTINQTCDGSQLLFSHALWRTLPVHCSPLPANFSAPFCLCFALCKILYQTGTKS